MEIELQIPKNYQNWIRTDSTAYLVHLGLLGQRIIDIHLGSAGPPVSPGGEINVGLVREASPMDMVNALKKLGAPGNCQDEKTPENKSSNNAKKTGQQSN